MERESERRELWHQLDNESDRAHDAFKCYMLLPPAERSVRAAWREWTGNPDAKREPPYFAGWAKDYAWSDRARARDHHLEVIREQGIERVIQQQAEWQARQVERVRGRFNELMAITYERAMEYLESEDFTNALRPADVVQIIKIHLEVTQKLAGGEANASGAAATVDWSEEEQRELDAILGEIDAEEAQEQSGEGPSEDLGGDYPEEGSEETG